MYSKLTTFICIKNTVKNTVKDYAVYNFLLENWKNLRFNPTIEAKNLDERRINPKRR
ncbi:MAG: DUF2992 family protein [Eubacteriaceae bacterium]